MPKRVIKKLWGGIKGAELAKFLYLAAGAFCLIGSYWPLKPLKESVFMNMVGTAYLPDVKQLTVLVVLGLVLIYSKLVDLFSKQKLIYFFVSVYSALGLGFVYLLSHPTIGVANTVASPDRYVAWAFYVFAESYLTLMVALYWSFINDITSADSAKKGYGMIVFGSQFGGLFFSFVGKILISDTASYNTRVPMIVSIAVGMFLMLGAIVWLLTHSLPPEQLQSTSTKSKKPKVGFIEGFKALVTHPYVMGIFGLVFFQEIITTVMGFQLARMVELAFADAALRTNFFFSYSVLLQLVATAFALLGTSYTHRRFGTRNCLIGFPFILLLSAGAYLVYPHLYTSVLFMLLIKALHYALNQPVKETLYIPTSRDIKYKSKAWIDMIGQRMSKYTGAQISKFIGFAPTSVGLVSVVGLGLWTVVAGLVGARNERAVRTKKIIE